MEQWKPVVGYEGFYEVSNLGRVRSTATRHPRWPSGRTMSPNRHPDGHLLVGLTRPGRKLRKEKVHRLVLEAFVGPCPQGMQACHNDGNPQNNCVENLRWDTPSRNQQDRRRHGTATLGETHRDAKLTALKVRLIRDGYASGVYQRELAVQYGVSQSVISSVVTRKTWSHVE